ncbi:Tetratricopeptide repeat protein 28 [Chelonia mydas]|uniref:Tetratricopeptide repeat protein 28 n=1 Tax=Chelonia mydas TaxID=8469 RepID=M7BYM7_CHEMY|nr:Tetratricopeptide repeat protein 28 [Chelonia mydas]
MVEAAMKSPMRESLEPTYQQLQKMKLDKSPFVVVSVVGQELLTAGHHGASVVVLEAALKIGTCSLKLRGSVFSALSSAYWSLGNTEKSTGYMQQDLDVAKTLGDQMGEFRAHGNLGSAFFSKGNYREALTNHRHQLVLAMKLKDRELVSPSERGLGVSLFVQHWHTLSTPAIDLIVHLLLLSRAPSWGAVLAVHMLCIQGPILMPVSSKPFGLELLLESRLKRVWYSHRDFQTKYMTKFIPYGSPLTVLGDASGLSYGEEDVESDDQN